LHTREELLACVVARLIGEAKHVAVGAASPIPATACELLKARGQNLRVSMLHKRKGNPFTEGSRELFDLAGQGRIDVFFLGGAQIDGEANINLVHAEGRRFPGSFGSAFMYFACRTILFFREEHSKRVLVSKVEFVSARGTPGALLTGRALFSWQGSRFRLESTHEAGDVRAETGFDFQSPERIPLTPPPTEEDLALLRSSVAQRIAPDYPDFARRVWGIN
jgi:glutaconate CoA-transferase subunit B